MNQKYEDPKADRGKSIKFKADLSIGKVDLEIENEGGGFNLPMIQNSKYSPAESPLLLAENTHLLRTRASSLV